MSTLSTAPVGRPYTYNAAFSYDGSVMRVNVTNFQYAWQIALSGKASTRQGQTVYPKRVEQTNISVNLVIRDQQEYLDFGKFIRAYHVGVTSTSNPPMMRLTLYGWAMGCVGEITYGVVVSDVAMAFKTDMDVAPQISGLRLELIENSVDVFETDTSSGTSGSFDDLVVSANEKVTSSEVSSSGASAYQSGKSVNVKYGKVTL